MTSRVYVWTCYLIWKNMNKIASRWYIIHVLVLLGVPHEWLQLALAPGFGQTRCCWVCRRKELVYVHVCLCLDRRHERNAWRVKKKRGTSVRKAGKDTLLNQHHFPKGNTRTMHICTHTDTQFSSHTKLRLQCKCNTYLTGCLSVPKLATE